MNDLAAQFAPLYALTGYSPWDATIRPRLHARADAILAANHATRVSAQRVLGVRPRDAQGRFVKAGAR